MKLQTHTNLSNWWRHVVVDDECLLLVLWPCELSTSIFSLLLNGHKSTKIIQNDTGWGQEIRIIWKSWTLLNQKELCSICFLFFSPTTTYSQCKNQTRYVVMKSWNLVKLAPYVFILLLFPSQPCTPNARTKLGIWSWNHEILWRLPHMFSSCCCFLYNHVLPMQEPRT